MTASVVRPLIGALLGIALLYLLAQNESFRAALVRIGRSGMNYTENVEGTERVNMLPDQATSYYLDVPKAYINRGVYGGGGQAFVRGSLELIIAYPDLSPPLSHKPASKYAIPLSIHYTGGKGTHKDYYLKNYDKLTAAPDEKIGKLYGYIYKRGPEFRLPPDGYRYVGGDIWTYLDKETSTYATLTCLNAGAVGKYYTCVTSMLLDDKYSLLFSIPGELQPKFNEFVSDLRQFLKGMEVAQ